MNFLVNEIEQAGFGLEKLKVLVSSAHELSPESSVRRLFEQAGRIARALKAVPSFLDEKKGLKRQDAEIEMERYLKLLEEARNSVE